jgi:hypothetical protein
VAVNVVMFTSHISSIVLHIIILSLIRYLLALNQLQYMLISMSTISDDNNECVAHMGYMRGVTGYFVRLSAIIFC